MGLFDRLAGKATTVRIDAADIEQPPLSAASMEQAKRAMQALQQQGVGTFGGRGISQLANAQGMLGRHLFDPYGADQHLYADDLTNAQKCFLLSQQQAMQVAQAKKDAEEARKKNSPNNRPAFQCALASLKDTWRARFGEEWVDTKNPPWNDSDVADSYWRDARERLVTNKAFEVYDGWVRLSDEA